jgi:hypothetical protein
MTTFQTDQEVIYYSEKFGLITENQIIIIEKNKHKKIKINSIAKVSLIKHRVFYLNSVLFVLSVTIFTSTYLFYKSEKMMVYLCLSLIGLFILVHSLLQKFYSYRIIIREKDKSIVAVQTNQFNRKRIKEFYSTIIMHIPKTK